MQTQLRIGRPVSNLERSAAMYREGLGLVELDRFADHEGFDGVMLGRADLPYHFEFTFCRAHPVAPTPTAEDLLVFYLPDPAQWRRACTSMLEAGFTAVSSLNPYWDRHGRTFEDHDHYRVVLAEARWEPSR